MCVCVCVWLFPPVCPPFIFTLIIYIHIYIYIYTHTGVGLAAMSVGLARRCVEVMNRYSKERKAFGEPLNTFGQIQKHIAESYAEYMVSTCVCVCVCV